VATPTVIAKVKINVAMPMTIFTSLARAIMCETYYETL
jgi:hypothetical protein